MLIGWNPTKKCIDDRGFDSGGGCDTLSWTVKSPQEVISCLCFSNGVLEMPALDDILMRNAIVALDQPAAADRS